jgi:tRNA A37 threonylcarbamoyladenosine synthetase subunit TsaC/SUA5/YrdC
MSNPVERVDITTGNRAEHLARGLKSIRDGYVIVVPLEHGYVYACDAFSHFAVRAMHVLRGDGLGVVAQVIIPNAKTAQGLSRSMRDDVQDITNAFWPGLLSINVKPQVGLAWDLGDSGRLDQISLRMPQEGFALDLLQKSGPLAIAGITNNTFESDVHPIYGNLDCMIQVMNENIEKTKLVYMNFNINTYPIERQYVFNLFHNKSWVSVGSIENTLEGRTQFLREIKSHDFVLCPRGNGLDTHRLWETLYMGSIPIVKRDIGNKEFEDLPICFIDHWEQINPEFLEKEKQRIQNNSWNMDRLKISYWIDKIQNYLHS